MKRVNKILAILLVAGLCSNGVVEAARPKGDLQWYKASAKYSKGDRFWATYEGENPERVWIIEVTEVDSEGKLVNFKRDEAEYEDGDAGLPVEWDTLAIQAKALGVETVTSGKAVSLEALRAAVQAASVPKPTPPPSFPTPPPAPKSASQECIDMGIEVSSWASYQDCVRLVELTQKYGFTRSDDGIPVKGKELLATLEAQDRAAAVDQFAKARPDVTLDGGLTAQEVWQILRVANQIRPRVLEKVKTGTKIHDVLAEEQKRLLSLTHLLNDLAYDGTVDDSWEIEKIEAQIEKQQVRQRMSAWSLTPAATDNELPSLEDLNALLTKLHALHIDGNRMTFAEAQEAVAVAQAKKAKKEQAEEFRTRKLKESALREEAQQKEEARLEKVNAAIKEAKFNPVDVDASLTADDIRVLALNGLDPKGLKREMLGTVDGDGYCDYANCATLVRTQHSAALDVVGGAGFDAHSAVVTEGNPAQILANLKERQQLVARLTARGFDMDAPTVETMEEEPATDGSSSGETPAEAKAPKTLRKNVDLGLLNTMVRLGVTQADLDAEKEVAPQPSGSSDSGHSSFPSAKPHVQSFEELAGKAIRTVNGKFAAASLQTQNLPQDVAHAITTALSFVPQSEPTLSDDASADDVPPVVQPSAEIAAILREFITGYNALPSSLIKTKVREEFVAETYSDEYGSPVRFKTDTVTPSTLYKLNNEIANLKAALDARKEEAKVKAQIKAAHETEDAEDEEVDPTEAARAAHDTQLLAELEGLRDEMYTAVYSPITGTQGKFAGKEIDYNAAAASIQSLWRGAKMTGVKQAEAKARMANPIWQWKKALPALKLERLQKMLAEDAAYESEAPVAPTRDAFVDDESPSEDGSTPSGSMSSSGESTVKSDAQVRFERAQAEYEKNMAEYNNDVAAREARMKMLSAEIEVLKARLAPFTVENETAFWTAKAAQLREKAAELTNAEAQEDACWSAIFSLHKQMDRATRGTEAHAKLSAQAAELRKLRETAYPAQLLSSRKAGSRSTQPEPTEEDKAAARAKLTELLAAEAVVLEAQAQQCEAKSAKFLEDRAKWEKDHPKPVTPPTPPKPGDPKGPNGDDGKGKPTPPTPPTPPTQPADWTVGQVAKIDAAILVVALMAQNFHEGYVGAVSADEDMRSMGQKFQEAFAALIELRRYVDTLNATYRVVAPAPAAEGETTPGLGSRLKTFGKNKTMWATGLAGAGAFTGYVGAKAAHKKWIK